MTDATDKQKKFLKSLGFKGDFDELTLKEAGEEIEKLMAAKDIDKAVEKGEPVYKSTAKKSYDTSSYYVAYAKDLCVAMLNAQAQFFNAGNMPQKDLVEVAALMGEAVQCIKFAQKEFR